MRDHAAEALALVVGLDQREFEADRVLQLAVVRPPAALQP